MLATSSPSLSAFLAPPAIPMATLTAAAVVSLSQPPPSSLHRSSFSAPCLLDVFAASMMAVHAVALSPPHGIHKRHPTSLSLFRGSSTALMMEPQNPMYRPSPPKNLLETSREWFPKDEEQEVLHKTDPLSHSLRHHLELDAVSSASAMTVRPAVVGHRGALFDELENTRAAFVRCAELKCQAVELDVFLLKDGTLVVFHGGGTDENPGDLTDYCLHQAGRNILDYTYPETAALAFNPNYAEFPCPATKIRDAVIPTLQQVLQDLKGSGCNIKIELKGQGVVEPVLKLVDSMDMVNQCEYSSFDHSRIQMVRTLHPERDPATGEHVYKTGALFNNVDDDFIHQAESVGASEIHLRYDTCTVPRIRAIHKAGFGSMAWFRGPEGMKSDTTDRFWDVGNENAACYQAVMDTGVQQLCCNRPDILVGMLPPAALAV